MTQSELKNPKILEDLGKDTVLCALLDIENPGSKGFRVGRRERLFVVRKDDSVFAYMNLCPHQGTTLDWKPDSFLTVEKDFILCATHGAFFEIENGLCIAGPCLGRSLAPIDIRVKDGKIFLGA